MRTDNEAGPCRSARRDGDVMKYLTPSTALAVITARMDKDDPRIRDIVEQYREGKSYDIGILGVPFDYGVELSGGRPGARHGPGQIRAALMRHGTTYNMERGIDVSGISVCDLGNVNVADRDSVETHERVSEVVSSMIKKGMLPIVLGGGHDITFANVRGLCNATKGKVGCINVDAHLDVRPVIDGRASSGTSFRRILEELGGRVSGGNLVELGAHDNLNAAAHLAYLDKIGSTVMTLNDITRSGMRRSIGRALSSAGRGTAALALSVDVDAMPQSVAPGCSAPSPRGIAVEDILDACFAAGADKRLKLFDIMELNPMYDFDGRTAMLAAEMIISFINGFATRGARS